MTELLDHLPFWPLVGTLFGIVFCRAQATYWIARLAVSGTARSRTGRRVVESGAVRRSSALLARWGLPVVAVSFVTIGLQTVMNAAAGAARVPWWRYCIAMVPGCVAWAFLYATIGLAVFWALLAAFAGSPWGVAVIVLVLALAALVVVVAFRRRRLREPRDP